MVWVSQNPCGGRVEYLHRDPASRRRRRKGKSQIWDSKIWSQVPRDSDPRMTALVRVSSIYKRQTRPLVREGSPQKQDRNCETVINIWSWTPDGARQQDLLTDRQSQCDFDFVWVSLVRGASLPGYEIRSKGIESTHWDYWVQVSSDLKVSLWRRYLTCHLKTLCVL
jgi:hypothetical protein